MLAFISLLRSKINFDPSDPYYLSLWDPDKVTAHEKTAEASQQQVPEPNILNWFYSDSEE